MPGPRRFGQVFVLCTGRCGSTTFAHACRHAGNYSVGHEALTQHLGDTRLAYPEGHIEVDNRLAWMLGRLAAKYGTAPLYVHLTRDTAVVAASYAARGTMSLLPAYRSGILMHAKVGAPRADDLAMATDLVATITANILQFLKAMPHVEHVAVETVDRDFPRFWDRIGAAGDLSRAMAEWQMAHNA